MNITQIQDLLKNPQATPKQLDDARRYMAAEASRLLEDSLRLSNLEVAHFVAHRGEYGSDTACTKAWDYTPEGRDQALNENTQKRITKLISSISNHLRVLENEARNIF